MLESQLTMRIEPALVVLVGFGAFGAYAVSAVRDRTAEISKVAPLQDRRLDDTIMFEVVN
jgi:hypothetical protein